VITLKGVSIAWRERAHTALTEVASSWHTSAAVRGEAGALLELKMIELHQQQALARVDADPRVNRLPPTLGDRKSIAQRHRLINEFRRLTTFGERRKGDNIDWMKSTYVLSISPVGDVSCINAELLGPRGTPYAGGVFKIELELPAEYPLAPPIQCASSHPSAIRTSSAWEARYHSTSCRVVQISFFSGLQL